MEGKIPQKSTNELILFKIPIEEYDNDMETESAKGKKNEIQDLLNNYNKLRCEDEFYEINQNLHEACREGDLDLIKIYLSETIENDSSTLKFKIDKANQTASLFDTDKDIKEVNIPRTFEHESIEYLITSVSGIHKNLQTLKFEEDSAVETIYGNTFSHSSQIKEIYFPASLKELKEGWYCNGYKLTKITISPMNGQFIYKDDKYLLGKSDPNKDEFDKLLFVRKDVKEISIPSYIKILSSQCCKNLMRVKIPTDSNLQTIESNVFSTQIHGIYFPESLKELKERWCHNTFSLNLITISEMNDQFIFEEELYSLLGKSDQYNYEFDILLFASRDIREISIPSNIKIISSCAFENCKRFRKIEIPANSNLQIIGSNAFTYSNITEIFIPSTVLKICEGAFENCYNLRKVEFSPDSNLQIIEKNAFAYSNIKKIFIPSTVLKICEGAFSDCLRLKKIEIPSNSNLQTIEYSAFSSSQFKEIYFPASLKDLKKGWCHDIEKLTKIIISPSNGQFIFKEDKYLIGKSDPNNDEFDLLLFASRDIYEISIPSNIKIISSYAFEKCKNLKRIEIPINSNLQTIEKYAFYESNINEFFISSNITQISQDAFYGCSNLQIVEISEESKLESNPLSIFSNNKNLIIMIPPSLEKIRSYK